MKQLSIILAAAGFLVGCQLAQWRVGQATVPKDQGKPPAQVQGERRGAEYILKRSAPISYAKTIPTMAELLADLQKQLADIHDVATGLSASLGEPDESVTVEDKDAVIRDLRAGNLAKDAKLKKYEDWSRKYGGKELEDTGINLAGPAGFLGLLGVIALCIFFPAFGYVILRALPVLWGFFSKTTEAIGDFAKANPDAGAKLANSLRGSMDSAQKALVRRRARRNQIPEPIAHPSPVSL